MFTWIFAALVLPATLVAIGWVALLWTEHQTRLMDQQKASRPAE